MEPAYTTLPTSSVGTGKVPMVAVNHFSFGIPVSSILTPPTDSFFTWGAIVITDFGGRLRKKPGAAR